MSVCGSRLLYEVCGDDGTTVWLIVVFFNSFLENNGIEEKDIIGFRNGIKAQFNTSPSHCSSRAQNLQPLSWFGFMLNMEVKSDLELYPSSFSTGTNPVLEFYQNNCTIIQLNC